MKKYFRRIRRNVCRWIVGFDTCPNGYHYNPRVRFNNIAASVAVSALVIAFFFFLVIICL